MKKLFITSLALIILASSYLLSYNATSKRAGVIDTEKSVEAFEEDDSLFVKEDGGKIAVCSNGDETVIKLDVFVFTLPDADRKMLSDGFRIRFDELQSLIEDYTG